MTQAKSSSHLFPNLIAAGFLLTAVFFLLRCFDIIHGMLLGWVIAPIWVAMLVLAVILLIGRAAKLGLALRLLPFGRLSSWLSCSSSTMPLTCSP